MADETPSDLSQEQLDQLATALGQGQINSDVKQNVHTFLFNVATANNTTKLGYLKDEEIGNADNTLRAFQVCSLFAESVMSSPEVAEFFKSRGEIITATSLSRQGFLVKQSTLQKRELADTTMQPQKQNKGWFKSKDKNEEGS